MTKVELKNHLLDLGNFILVRTKEYKITNEDQLQITRCEFRPVTNIHYQYDNVGYSLDRKNFFQYNYFEWKDSGEAIRFAEQISRDYDKLKTVINSIDKWVGENLVITDIKERAEHLHRFVIRKLISVVSDRALQDTFEPSAVDEIVEQLIADITLGSQVHFTAKIFLKNIWIEQDCIEIYKDVRLRRVAESELNETTTHLYESEMDRLTGRVRWVNCFLEIDAVVKNGLGMDLDKERAKIRKYSNDLICAIRLYKIADIHEDSIQYSTNSIMHYTFDDSLPTPYSAYMDSGFLPKDGVALYEKITFEDMPNLRLIFHKLKPIISRIKKSSYFEGEPHEIAFHRYMDSLLRSQLHINRISYCLYSLDAILVHYDEQGKEKKITHRAARIISIYTCRPLEPVKQILTDAYQIRSRLVHGDKIDGHLRAFAQTQTKEIINFTRIVLVAFLQYSQVGTKDQFIDLLKAADVRAGIERLKLLLRGFYIPNV
jgi:hypothetical protein